MQSERHPFSKGTGFYGGNFYKKLKNKWFVTYDNTDLIKELYSDCKTEIFNIQYSAGSKRVENEIAVYSDSIDNILVP